MINTSMRLSGLATGMDTENVIRQLMQIERIPLNKKLKEKQIWQWKQEDYRTINTRLLALKNKTFDMTLNATYLLKQAVSTNENIATASAGSSALNGIYNFKVLQLAEAATNASSAPVSLDPADKIDPTKSLLSQKDKFADTSFFAGNPEDTDTFTVNINGKDLTFKYGDSLNKILSTINADKDIKVSIFYDSGTDRLALTSKTTGVDAQLEVSGAFFTDLLKVDNSTKVAGKDDVTGEALIQRDDDREETVRKRLEVYHAQTRQLVDYYGKWAADGQPGAPKYRKIAGVGTVEEIRQRAFDALR